MFMTACAMTGVEVALVVAIVSGADCWGPPTVDEKLRLVGDAV
jgi:hypothetical protein